MFDGNIKHTSRAGNTACRHNIKLGEFKRRSNFVFNNFGTVAGANDGLSFGNIANLAHIDPNGRVKFEGLSTSSCFGITKHDTDFHSELIGKDHNGFTFADSPG